MIYIDISFDCGQTIETKQFHTAKKALSFMYAMRAKGHFILAWRCDDPYDNNWLERRIKL